MKIKFWFFSALIFLAFSLGQAIHIYNRSYDLKWLPYNLIYTYIPFFQIGRTPFRFSLMVELCCVIFSSYGLCRLFNWGNHSRVYLLDLKNFLKGFLIRKGMPVGIVLLVCLEFVKLPTALINVKVPECYQKLREIKGDFAILEAPASFTGTAAIANIYMLYQTVHEKKEVNGSLTRPSYHAADLLKELSADQEVKLDSTFIDKLARNNVQYLIIHKYQKTLQGTLKWNKNMSYSVFEEEPTSIGIIQTF
jgi:hypothetical protein